MSSKYDYEDVKKLFEDQKYTLLSTEYKYGTKLKYLCNNNHEGDIRFSNFVAGQRCRKCTNIIRTDKSKLPFDTIKQTFEAYNCDLIIDKMDYKNCKSILSFKCINGHLDKCTYALFKKRIDKCIYCEKSKKEIIRYTYGTVKQIFCDKKYILLSTEYINCYKELDFMCDKGHISKITLIKLMQNGKCHLCNSSRQKITYDYIKSEFDKLNFTLKSIEYKGYDDLLEYICPNNHLVKASYHSWKNSTYKCGKCGRNKCGEKTKLSIEYVKIKFEERGFTLLSTTYKDKKEKLEFKCPNGHIEKISFDSFYYAGNGCSICSETKKHTIETARKIFENEGYELLSNIYIDNKHKLQYKCSKGHINETKLNYFICGNRCPECNDSNGEEIIKKYLDSVKLTYTSQKKYPECKNINQLPFDLLVNNQFIIEFDGKQHFTPVEHFGGKTQFDKQKKHDYIKTTYCIQNKIPLLRISYKEIKLVPELINNFITTLKTHNKNTPLVHFSNNFLYKDQMMLYINHYDPSNDINELIKQNDEEYENLQKEFNLLKSIKN